MDGLFTPSIDPKSYASNYNKSSSFILMHSLISCACTNNRFLYREMNFDWARRAICECLITSSESRQQLV